MDTFFMSNQQLEEKAQQADIWQERAYTAEQRVSGLEQEREQLQAKIDELHQGLKHLFVIADTPVLERAIARLLGHSVACDWLIGGDCSCGVVGAVVARNPIKSQGDHYPKAVSE